MDIKNFDFNKFESRYLCMVTGSEDEFVRPINNNSPTIRNWHKYHRKKWIELVCAYDFNYDFMFVKVKKSRLDTPKSYYDFRSKKWIIQFEDVTKEESIYDTSVRFGLLVNEILFIHNFIMTNDRYGLFQVYMLALKFGVDIFPNFDTDKLINRFTNPEAKKILKRVFGDDEFIETFKLMSVEDVLNWVQYFMNDDEEDEYNGNEDSMGDQTSE